MKKIININLSGRVIPIEDSAYEKLQAYIESLRRYFANEEGRDEIINDIESRMAELMSEKIRLGSAAITDPDMSEIIATMGTVEDFEAVENETAGKDTASSTQQRSATNSDNNTIREKRRLYRDSSDKMLGGVCAGLANYLNVDTAIVRLLFAILLIGGFGILIYIILWIVLPPRDLDQFAGKRLYRNPEDKIFGGVAGGLAAYFNRSTSVIRLLFAAPILLNILFSALSWPFFHEGHWIPNLVFGSLSGTFIFAYIILWIVLPEANSQYQKMEMRGEKVDVNSIRQNVKEGMENMKGRMKEWGQEVKESAQNLSGKAREFAGTRGKAFVSEANDAVRRTSHSFGHVIGVIFKAFFLFVAGSIAFGLFVALIGLLIGGIGIWPITNFILDGFWQNAFAWGTLILFLGVPLIGFIIWLLRRIMRVRSQSNYLGWIFGGLWILGWVSVSLFAASLFNDFRMTNDRTDAKEIQVTQPANGKMIVKVSEPEVEYSGSLPWININRGGMDITKDTFKLSNVRIRVELSKDADYHVEVKKYSHGKSLADAEEKALNMVFNTSYSDSILDVGSGFAIGKDTKYRGQQAIVIIKIPTGKKIKFEETVKKLHPFNIRFNDRHQWNKNNRYFDMDFDDYFDYKTNVDYTMGADGVLKGPSGETATQSTPDYRYKATDSSLKNDRTKEIQQQIDSIRKENERKIKELEDKKKTVDQKPTARVEKKGDHNKDGFIAAGPSVYSMTQWF